MSTTLGEWFEWTEDHPLEIIKHRSRLEFHNTSGCVSWVTEGEKEDRLWSGPEWDAFRDAHETAETERLRAQLAEARAVLKLVEAKMMSDSGYCQVCECHGHAPTCRLAKAIGE